MPEPEREFEGRTVVVTGGTGALGVAVVGELLRRGATCHVPVLDRRELASFPLEGAQGLHLHDAVDLRDEHSVSELYDRVGELWASIQLAGGFRASPVDETTADELRALLEMNAVTCFLCCAAAVRRLRAQGEGGRLVNVSARPALVPAGGSVAYAASKAAVAALTTCLAEEVSMDGIWVNAVVPTIFDTPANRRAMPDAPFERWPSAADVAETIVFLASPSNRATRGALVPVPGRAQ